MKYKLILKTTVIFFITVGLFLFTAKSNQVKAQVVQNLGYTYTSGGWGTTYTMGYRFTPTTNGQVTKLWCYLYGNGTTVTLWSDAGTRLASASVNCPSGWGWVSITPVSLTAGTYYRISQWGANYYVNAPTLPVTSNNIQIVGYAYQTGSDVFPTNTGAGAIYGVPDMTFSPTGTAVSNFTDTFSVARYLDADPNYVKMGGSPQLYASGSNLGPGTCTTTANQYAKYRTLNTFTSPDYSVSMDIVGGSSAYYHFALFARAIDEGNNYYFNTEFGSNSWLGTLVNYSQVNYITIGSAPTNGDKVTLTVKGNQISVSWGGVVKGTITDNNFTTAGSAGFGMGQMSSMWGTGAASNGCLSTQAYDNFIVSTNTPPTFTSNPSASYGSYTRTGVGNSTFNVNFTATDAEQTGANALTYTLKRSSDNATIGTVTGNFTSGQGQNIGIAYNATNLAEGSNTLYVQASDGTLTTNSNTFTVLRDDTLPTAAASISTNPATVLTNTYTVTFTPNDAISTNTNEISYKICATNDTCVSPLAGGTGTATSGQAKTTGSITDNGLVAGSNFRWIRTCDGANNCTNTQFTVTYAPAPTGITTTAYSGLSSYQVTMNGTINPNGSNTHYYFRYFTSADSPFDCTNNVKGTRVPSSSLADPVLGFSDTSSHAVSMATPSTVPLQRQTQYWYCLYAYNDSAPGVTSTSTPIGGTTFTTIDGPASPCDAPSAGNLSVSQACTFPDTSADGVDAGGNTSGNSGVLTLGSGGIVTVLPGQVIGVGSKRFSGGSFAPGNGTGVTRLGAGIWLKDSDGDGIIDTPIVKTVSVSPPAGYIRRNFLTTTTAYTGSSYDYASKLYNLTTTGVDCDSSNGNIYQNVASVDVDQDQDGYKTSAAPSSQCVGGSTTIGAPSRTYYKDSSGNFTRMNDANKLSATADCQDNPNGAPCAPSSVSSSAPAYNQTSISWSGTQAGGAVPAVTNGYDLVWCSGSSCTPSATLTNVTSPYTHNGLSQTTTYGYAVKAKNAAGAGAASSTSYVTTPSNCTNYNLWTDSDGDGYGNSGTITQGLVSAKGANATSIVVNKPADIVDGMLMIAVVNATITSNGVAKTITATGWNVISDSTTGTTTSDTHQVVYYKWASAEPTTYTFSFSGTAGDAEVIITSFANVDKNTPIETSASSTTANPYSAPSVTTSTANDTILTVFGGIYAAGVFTAPTGMAQAAGSNMVNGTYMSYKTQASPGVSGSFSTTYTHSGNVMGQTIVLKNGYTFTTQCLAAVPSGFATNGNDCNDDATSRYQNLQGYPDSDADGYGYNTLSVTSSPTSSVNDNSNNHPNNAWTINSAQNASYSPAYQFGQSMDSQYLKSTGFGFNIPAGAKIFGIKINYTGYHVIFMPYGGVPGPFYIVKAGTIQTGRTFSSNGVYPTSTGGSATYAGDMGLTYTDINNSGFGVAIYDPGYNDNAGTFSQASVTGISMTIYYQPASGSTVNACSGASLATGYSNVNTDCYDNNANARPGQTSYFSTNRGDNSFDYDCDQLTAYPALANGSISNYNGGGCSINSTAWYNTGSMCAAIGCYFTDSTSVPFTSANAPCGNWYGLPAYTDSFCSTKIGYLPTSTLTCR